MILNVDIKNWRAYQHVSLDLSAAVVFFVAPNGVGKSSLVEAVRWCLLGQPTAKKSRVAVRRGAQEAVVTIELRIDADAPNLTVARTLTTGGKTSVTARLGERELSEEAYYELLRDRWAAELPLIDSLMFTDPSVPASKSSFPVRDHLAATLGVTQLLATADELEVTRKDLASRVLALKADADQNAAALDDLDEALEADDAALDGVSVERLALEQSIKDVEQSVVVAQRWHQYRNDVAGHSSRTSEVLERLSAYLEMDPAQAEANVSQAQSDAQARLEEARNLRASTEIARARTETAAELLQTALETCPTCLRPLTSHERDNALEQHGESASGSAADLTESENAISSATERTRTIAGFVAELGSMRPPEHPDDEDPGEAAQERLEILRIRDRELAEEYGRMQAEIQLGTNRRRLAELVASKRVDLAAVANEEQLVGTTIEILNSVADKTLSDRIDPLIRELSARWKVLFGTEGLMLEPSGGLIVENAHGPLTISDLSGGERATALLIARLLITASTTRIPTVWFDEPLEHLDPRRRAAVAKTIVRAGQTGTVSQLIVTTYEDRIARQLAAADPESVRIVHADIDPSR